MGFAVARSSLAKSPRAPRFICSSTTSIRPSVMSRVDPPVNVRGRSSNHVNTDQTGARIPDAYFLVPAVPRRHRPPRFRKTRTASVQRRARRSSAPATKAKPGRRIILHQPMRDAARDVVWRARCRAARRDRAKYAFFSTRSRRRGARTQRFLASRDAHG